MFGAERVSALLSDPGAALGPDAVAARRDSLPAAVRRYLEYSVAEGAPAIRSARLTHDGFFRTKYGGRWFAIAGEEHFTVEKPGFVWSGAIRPLPLVRIAACDSLLGGQGRMLVKLNSLWTIANVTGPEISRSATLRWLAEMVWFPPGFAGARIGWEQLDRHSARVVLLQEDPPLTAEAEFDEEGRLLRMCADRYRDLGGGKTELAPWGCRYTDYRDFGGFRVPASGEAFWKLETGEFPYARVRVKTLEYGS